MDDLGVDHLSSGNLTISHHILGAPSFAAPGLDAVVHQIPALWQVT